MVTCDQLIANSLSLAGQIYLTPQDLLFTDLVLAQNIFTPVVREYERFRPANLTVDVVIGAAGLAIDPCWKKVVRLRKKSINVADIGFGVFYKSVPSIEYEIINNKVIAGIPGYYNLEYLGEFTVQNLVPATQVYLSSAQQLTICFQLPSRPVLGTVTLQRMVGPGAGNFDSVTDVSGLFSTTWLDPAGTNTVDEQGNVTLTFTPEAQGRYYFFATYVSVYPCVLELNLRDEPFSTLFNARFLTAYAHPKSNAKVEGLPFDINQEDLVSYSKLCVEKWEKLSETGQKWWIW